MLQLDKVDPKFRLLTDQFFFTDRTDLDVSEFKLLFDNKDVHYDYLWDRFSRSSEIFWDEAFWINRFELLLSLNVKRIETNIESLLLSKFRNLLMYQYNASPQYHSQYIHFIAWTKAKVSLKEDIIPIRDFFIGLVHSMQVNRITSIIENFIPHLFKNLNEYLELLGKKVSQSARNFQVLQQLEKQGVPIDRGPIFNLVKNLLVKRALNRPNRRSFFAMIDDQTVLNYLKSEYKPEHRSRLVELVKACDYKEIEELHLRNVKNLLELDSSITDELLKTYADGLYSRGTGNKKANVQRLIRLCKTYPQFSPKKVLVYLSSNNKMSDIKHLISAFPDLKTLAPFI